jgi:hypothetical protein
LPEVAVLYLVRDRHTTNSCFTRRHLTENEVKGKNVFIDQILSTDLINVDE